MHLSENMERSAALLAEGSPAPGPGTRKKFKVMDRGVSPQVKQGCDKPRPGSAAHRPTLLQDDPLQRPSIRPPP